MSQAKLRALPSIGHLVDDPGQPGQLEALKDKDDEALGPGKLVPWVVLIFTQQQQWPLGPVSFAAVEHLCRLNKG